MAKMKYPIGIQSFETIRRDGYVYVDKTDLIYKLAQGHICFLARPRRFGKSLLISTLKAYFEGRRDLFEGLKMMDLEQDWTKYPVISFDFNGLSRQENNPLRNYLFSQIIAAERKYNITPEGTDDLGLRFRQLIPAIHEATGQRVVVLIDEYDKPLLDLLETGNPDDGQQLAANRELLKAFFSIFKAFLTETPYSMRPKKDQKDRELYFHYTFYLLMRLISCYTVYTEKQLSEGRADCIVETPQYVYIFEFKLDGTADEGLAQINKRGYGKPYESDNRQMYFVGASFSSKMGTVEEWKVSQQRTGSQSV